MTNQKEKNNRTDELFSVKYPKMLSFSQVAEALTGLIYHRPSGENFSSQASGARFVESPQCNGGHEPEWPTPEIWEKAANVARSLNR